MVLGAAAVTLVGASPMAGVALADIDTMSPEEAIAQDLSLTAEGRGWTLDEAVAQHRAAEVIGKIAVQLSNERPEVFVGSALSEEPGGAPTSMSKVLRTSSSGVWSTPATSTLSLRTTSRTRLMNWRHVSCGYTMPSRLWVSER